MTSTVLMLFVIASSVGGQRAATRSRDVAIPIEEWDDDWGYPEGSLKLLGTGIRCSLVPARRRFASANARSKFGSTLIEPEIEFFRPTHKGVSVDVDFAWTACSDARIIAPTLGVRNTFAESKRANLLVPFGVLRAGPYFTRAGSEGSGTVVGANATLGIEVARHIVLSARYDWLPTVRGNDLSTLRIRLITSIPLGRNAVTRAKMRDDVPAPGRLVDVDAHRMHLLCIGSGSPTVVFETGLSDAWISWVKVQPAIARQTRACSYDRAGMGYSDPSPTPRTSERSRPSSTRRSARPASKGPTCWSGIHSAATTSAFLRATTRAKWPDSCLSMPPTRTSKSGFPPR